MEEAKIFSVYYITVAIASFKCQMQKYISVYIISGGS